MENKDKKKPAAKTKAQTKAAENLPAETKRSAPEIRPSSGPAKESAKDDDKGSLVIGITAVIIIFALFALAISAVNKSTRQTVGSIGGDTVTRLGQKGTVTYDLGKDVNIAEGTDIIWYVDGHKVSQTKYVKGMDVSLEYTPTHLGKERVRVDVGGKFTQTKDITVNKPVVTLKARDITVTYGDPLPELCYDCSGLLAGDSMEFLAYDGKCVVPEGKLKAGVYTINFDKQCASGKYDAECVGGTLTVLPRQLKIAGGFTKVYDGNNYVYPGQLKLDGVIEGDDVKAECEKLYFTDKNVGLDKPITTANVELKGEDSCNYCLAAESLTGNIVPRKVSLEGLSVENKVYDGNSKATVLNPGKLKGVIEGDSVAIGTIEAEFDDAAVGNGKKVKVNKITLVGFDKDNYLLTPYAESKADITQSLFDKLLNKSDAVHGVK